MADDITKVVADLIMATLPGWSVDTKVPTDIPHGMLPLVVLTEQPGIEGHKPWNHRGPITETASIDIDLMGNDVPTLKHAAQQVARVLYSLKNDHDNSITEVYCPSTFAVRPDWNDRVHRVGAEFDFTHRP